MQRYRKSELHLNRAQNTIPIGSQTFSKSRTQYPVGISPLYIDKARGCKVWDLDGNVYIDLVSALASVTLGYGDKNVNNAVKKQLKKGVSFSLPGTLEAEVAEMLCEMIPSAEMVRFAKNGTDATSAAVRLSRAFTGRDHILVCGYHGWQDWYIGSTSRNKGIPDQISSLTHPLEFNNIEELTRLIESLPNQIACIVMEPMNVKFPNPGYLEQIRELTEKHGIVLVFDETITGFRFSTGGAQEFFGVTPDISTFGKGLANGFPLSAVVGKREIMMEMEEIFFSGTFGGELLSLAAAKEVLSLHLSKDICGVLGALGNRLSESIHGLLEHHKLEKMLLLSGHPSWKFLLWSDFRGYTADELRTYFMQEAFASGLLILGTLNLMLAHQEVEEEIVKRFDRVFLKMSLAIESGQLKELLSVEPLRPLFKVR
jgi:glutamate-1-semialdehyde 2,1-aminomutase